MGSLGYIRRGALDGSAVSVNSMKFLTFLALVAAVVASPANRKRRPAVTLEGNPFESYTLHANSHYSTLVEAAIGNLSDSSLEPAAQVVKETGTFLWL